MCSPPLPLSLLDKHSHKLPPPTEGMWLALKHPGTKAFLRERRDKSIEAHEEAQRAARDAKKEKEKEYKEILQRQQVLYPSIQTLPYSPPLSSNPSHSRRRGRKGLR